MRNISYWNEILHTECGCIENDIRSESCLKRVFFVTDIENSNYKYISVCNNFLRLKIQYKKRLNNSSSYYVVDEVLKEVFSQYVKIYTWENSRTFGNPNEIFETYITYEICSRPYILGYMSFKDALYLCLDKENYMVSDLVFEKVREYLDNIRYKKYKTKYKECLSIIRKIKKSYGDEKRTLIHTLFTIIFELNIKIYETSKQQKYGRISV